MTTTSPMYMYYLHECGHIQGEYTGQTAEFDGHQIHTGILVVTSLIKFLIKLVTFLKNISFQGNHPKNLF